MTFRKKTKDDKFLLVSAVVLRMGCLLLCIWCGLGCPSQHRSSLQVKYFYTDLDGTLLNQGGKLSEENQKAILRFKQHGGKFGIATGRTPNVASKDADAAQADLPRIYADGAIITDAQGKIIRLLALENSEVVQAVCQVAPLGECGYSYTALVDLQTQKTWMEEGVCRAAKSPDEKVVRIRLRQCGKLELLLQKIQAIEVGGFSFEESGSGSYLGVSISAPGVEKGQALAFVAKSLNLDPKQMAFIGDSGNDISAALWIQKQGGKCFAMKNATQSLIEVCPNLTEKDHQQAGVGQVLDGLINLR